MEISPIPVAARFMVWVCGRSLPGTTGSNPARGMDICLVWVSCVIGRGLYVTLVLPRVACPMSVIAKLRNERPWPGIGSKRHKKYKYGKQLSTKLIILKSRQ